MSTATAPPTAGREPMPKRGHGRPKPTAGPAPAEATTENDADAEAPEVASRRKGTVIWGIAEGGDWIPVPRALLLIGTSDDPRAKQLKPRHIVLALSLAAKKFKDKKTRRLWHYVAKDLNVSRDTVRKWAYELERFGLLKIKRYKDKSSGIGRSTPGYRNESNEFDLTPFVEFVENLYVSRAKVRIDRANRKRAQAARNGS